MGRIGVFDYRRGLVYSWGIGKFWNKDCILELGCGCSVVVVVCFGFVENIGIWKFDLACAGSCWLGMVGIFEEERRLVFCGSFDIVFVASFEGLL